MAVASLCFSYNEQYLATLGGQDDNSLVVRAPAALNGAVVSHRFARSGKLPARAEIINFRWSMDSLEPILYKFG